MTYVFDYYSELEDICQATHKKVDPSECAECHRQAYVPGGVPDYACDNFQKVYVIRYLAAHTVQLEESVSKCFGEQMTEKTVIRGASLGGGPGVEAIALMNQLRSSERNHTVVFHNFDRENSWRPIYFDLLKRFAGHLENICVRPVFRLLNFPIVKLKAPDHKPYHIVFVSWILSELDGQEMRSKLLEQVLGSACDEGYIVIADRTEGGLIEQIGQLVERTEGCNLLDCNLEHEGNCHEVDFPREIWDAFGPQANYSTAYWVLRKG